MGKFGKYFKSTFGWEDSYFGGYYSVLDKYPEIKVNAKLDWEKGETLKSTMGYYSYNKLIKIFLHRVQENNLQMNLIKGMTKKTREKTRWFSTGKVESEEYLELSKDSVAKCVTAIIGTKEEFANLIDYFKETIIGTVFTIPLEFNEEPNPNDLLTFVSVRVKKPKPPNAISGKYKENAVLEILSGDKRIKYAPNKIEMAIANKLLNLLDIDYDPRHDRVNNLRAGRLDTNKLVQATTGDPNLYFQEIEEQITKPFSVVILCDESGSMTGTAYAKVMKIELQQMIVRILWETFTQILPEDKIYIYGHSTTEEKVASEEDPDYYDYEERAHVRVYNEPGNLNFESSISEMLENNHENNLDGPAIEIVHDRIRNMTNDNILFISISDGQPAGESYGGPEAIKELKQIIEMCRRDNFVTAGIGLRDETVSQIYPNYVVLKSLDIDTVASSISRLLNHVVKTEFQ